MINYLRFNKIYPHIKYINIEYKLDSLALILLWIDYLMRFCFVFNYFRQLFNSNIFK